jgi:hypothetical protein
MTDVLPYVPTPTPGNFGRWEFIRLVNRLPNDSYYVNPVGLPERGQNLYFAFAVRAELERRAGGPVAENVGRVYTLDADDKAYLGGLGVNADALLAEMNEMTNITADHNARNYAAHYFDPSGDIRRPVLTVHTTGVLRHGGATGQRRAADAAVHRRLSHGERDRRERSLHVHVGAERRRHRRDGELARHGEPAGGVLPGNPRIRARTRPAAVAVVTVAWVPDVV